MALGLVCAGSVQAGIFESENGVRQARLTFNETDPWRRRIVSVEIVKNNGDKFAGNAVVIAPRVVMLTAHQVESNNIEDIIIKRGYLYSAHASKQNVWSYQPNISQVWCMDSFKNKYPENPQDKKSDAVGTGSLNPDIAFLWLPKEIEDSYPFWLHQEPLDFETMAQARDVLVLGIPLTLQINGGEVSSFRTKDGHYVREGHAMACPRTSFVQSPCGQFGLMYDMKHMNSENGEVVPQEGDPEHAGLLSKGWSGGCVVGRLGDRHCLLGITSMSMQERLNSEEDVRWFQEVGAVIQGLSGEDAVKKVGIDNFNRLFVLSKRWKTYTRTGIFCLATPAVHRQAMVFQNINTFLDMWDELSKEKQRAFLTWIGRPPQEFEYTFLDMWYNLPKAKQRAFLILIGRPPQEPEDNPASIKTAQHHDAGARFGQKTCLPQIEKVQLVQPFFAFRIKPIWQTLPFAQNNQYFN